MLGESYIGRPGDKVVGLPLPSRDELIKLLLDKYPFARVVSPFSPIYQASLQPSLLEPEDAELLSRYIDKTIRGEQLII